LRRQFKRRSRYFFIGLRGLGRHSLAVEGSAILAYTPMKRRSKHSFRLCRQAFACALGILLLASGSAGQRERLPGQDSSPALRKAISDAAAKYKIPGIAAALIQNGQIRGLEFIGVRDEKTNAPVTANTIFEAGSLGEPVYAYAVLRLATDGRLNPAMPLPTYLPLPYVRNLDPTSSSPATEPLYDPRLNQITAMRVMSHSSGMPDLARNQHLAIQYPPGQKWSYSSEGYLYLQQVVEHITGESYEDFVTRGVFALARMPRSNFVWRDADANEIATGYDRSGAPLEPHKYSRPAATLTLYSTIRDYAQFVGFLLASAPAQRAHESAVTLMLSPAIAVGDAVPFSWGLGVGLEKTGDDLFFFHREKSAGFQCFFIASRKTGNAIVIFTNSGNGLDAVPEIVAATLGGNHPILKSTFLHSQ
jgi:CubicO group peptidase (beta-lactamase class C family)